MFAVGGHGLLLQLIEAGDDVVGDTVGEVGLVGGLKTASGDVLVELDVALADAGAELGSHLGHLLAGLAHEAVLDEPLAHKLLGELTLGLSGAQTLLVAVGIEVARRVGGVDFVNQDDLALAQAELILGVDQDEALLGGHTAAALKEGAGVALHGVIVLGRDNALSDNLLTRDVHVVAGVGLGGGGHDGAAGECLVFDHAVGETDAANLAGAGLIVAPCAAGEIAADDHFNSETFTLVTDGDHRVGAGELPVGDDVGGGVEEVGRNLVEHLTLVGDALGEDDVKGRDAVGGDHDHQVVVDSVDIAHFAVIDSGLPWEIVVGGG